MEQSSQKEERGGRENTRRVCLRASAATPHVTRRCTRPLSSTHNGRATRAPGLVPAAPRAPPKSGFQPQPHPRWGPGAHTRVLRGGRAGKGGDGVCAACWRDTRDTLCVFAWVCSLRQAEGESAHAVRGGSLHTNESCATGRATRATMHGPVNPTLLGAACAQRHPLLPSSHGRLSASTRRSTPAAAAPAAGQSSWSGCPSRLLRVPTCGHLGEDLGGSWFSNADG